MMTIRSVRPDSKVQLLCDRIYLLALERGPGEKLPTIRELCALFDTSLTTLVEALRILQEQQIVERRHGSGLFVSLHIHRKNICVLFYSRLFLRSQSSPFWGMLWSLFGQEIEQRMAMRDENWTMHLVVQGQKEGPNLPDSVLTLLQTNSLHGVLAVGIDLATYQWLAERNIPVVTFASFGDATVEIDIRDICSLGINTLIQQGCRRITAWGAFDEDIKKKPRPKDILALAKGQAELESFDMINEELRIIYKILTQHQFPIDESLLLQTAMPGQSVLKQPRWPTYQEQGYLRAREVFGGPQENWPDGLLLMDDMFTDGLMTAFKEMNIAVGDQIKVVTAANVGSSTLFWCQRYLWRIMIDPAAYVRTMFELLDAFLQKRPLDEPHIRLKSSLQAPTEISSRLIL